MPFGGSSGGTTTVTQNTVNPAQQAQQPFLTDVYNQAQQQYNAYGNPGTQGVQDPYINQLRNYLYGTAANTAPFLQNQPALAGLANSGILNLTDPNMRGLSNLGSYYSGLTGSNNPYLAGLSGIGNTATGYTGQPISSSNAYAAATAPYTSGLSNLSGAALNNPASGALGWLSSGAVLNPSSNPALASAIQSAQQPTITAYQTATAPQTASQFEGAGRYGSGAYANAQGVNQYGLGLSLGNIASQMANQNYQTGLQAMGNAAANQGNIYNTGVSNAANALNAAGQLNLNAGQLANQGYQVGNQFLNTGANAYTQGGNLQNQVGSLLNSIYGTGLNSEFNAIGEAPTLANYPANAYQGAYSAGNLPLQNYASLVGGAIGGSSNQSTTQPYYTNQFANVLGTLGGGLALGQGLAGAAGYSSLGALLAASDRRIKQDIELIGQLENGLTVYRFRYIGANDNRIGLMADEVERIRPEAVITLGGLKLVNYALAAA